MTNVNRVRQSVKTASSKYEGNLRSRQQQLAASLLAGQALSTHSVEALLLAEQELRLQNQLQHVVDGTPDEHLTDALRSYRDDLVERLMYADASSTSHAANAGHEAHRKALVSKIKVINHNLDLLSD